MFCAVLAYTGARISEVLALAPSRIDTAAGVVVFESLKKRKRGVFRAVPVPAELLHQLESVCQNIEADCGLQNAKSVLWPWGRTTAWRRVKHVMAAAKIQGPQASPKGLRHGFGVGAIQAGVPLNIVRKWLGHARLSTTAIYADAVGKEERNLAERFWDTFPEKHEVP